MSPLLFYHNEIVLMESLLSSAVSPLALVIIFHCALQGHRQRTTRVSTYNFCIDVTVASAHHLGVVHLWRPHSYKLNTSLGAIIAHKWSGILCYFHTQQLLPIAQTYPCSEGQRPAHATGPIRSARLDGPRGWSDAGLGLMHCLHDQRGVQPES